MHRVLGHAIYALSALLGVAAFAYPFFTSAGAATPGGLGHGQDALLVTTALVGLSLVALLVELQGQSINAKTVAMLGVLVAIASALRFIEVAIPLPGGFSPIFAPIILAGYVFGGRFGFLMGAFTLLASALITGGVGPWLPYQMFTAGWVGMTAGWLARMMHRPAHVSRWHVLSLCGFGFAWGLLYGLIINLYFWPFAAGPGGQSWAPDIGLGALLARYGAFYVATSLVWDIARAAGNAALIWLLGEPVIKALARFQRRFHFEVHSVYA
ncbi:MAG: ECF transporter S component [Thermoflexales bacterium]|nr:ECF transporter S component [Thermoflexales bacterium]